VDEFFSNYTLVLVYRLIKWEAYHLGEGERSRPPGLKIYYSHPIGIDVLFCGNECQAR
jgi:hypothetical protein